MTADEKQRLEKVQALKIEPYMKKKNWRRQAKRRRDWQMGATASREEREL